jgi:hypothetical protein
VLECFATATYYAPSGERCGRFGEPAAAFCFAVKRLETAGQTRRSTIIFLISAIALAGFRPFGQVWAQFMIVWQR